MNFFAPILPVLGPSPWAVLDFLIARVMNSFTTVYPCRPVGMQSGKCDWRYLG